jgi:hypothetical protein
VARSLHVMPRLDAALNGDKPHLGFGLLTCTETSAVYRVIFEAINDAKLAPGPIWTSIEPPLPNRPSFEAGWRDD